MESTGVLQPDPTLKNNSEETDTRVWRHVQQTTSSKCLVVSPDTDVYMIGLPLYHGENKDIIVQINPYNKREVQYLHLTALITVLQNDPDLAEIDQHNITHIFQSLYIASGSDYTSFFSGIGKSTFMKTTNTHGS